MAQNDPSLPNSTGLYTCPVCGNDALKRPPYDEYDGATFSICPCCGIEFGYDDSRSSHSVLREEWIASGMKWWSSRNLAPEGWDPIAQLRRAGF
ncbi:hypothetical protein BH11ACT3_BH11ACT3_01020 [soil metagenome]